MCILSIQTKLLSLSNCTLVPELIKRRFNANNFISHNIIPVKKKLTPQPILPVYTLVPLPFPSFFLAVPKSCNKVINLGYSQVLVCLHEVLF